METAKACCPGTHREGEDRHLVRLLLPGWHLALAVQVERLRQHLQRVRGCTCLRAERR